MRTYNEIFGALVQAEARPAPIATGEWPGTGGSFAVAPGQEAIVVWYYHTEEDAEAWTIEVYAHSAERVADLELWVLARLSDELGEVMGWDEEGVEVPWMAAQADEDVAPVMFAGILNEPPAPA